MKVLGHAVIVASVLTACLAVIPQITSVEVPFGGTVSLHCNYGGGDLDLKWESKGKDVASYLDGQVVAGKGFEGRVQLSQSEDSEGTFSLTLTNVVTSDAGVYECVWQGRGTLAKVTLNVLSTSELPLFQAGTTATADLTGFTVDVRTDTTTEQDAVEVFQTFTPEDTTGLLEMAFGVTDKTKSSTSMEEPGLITPDSEDSTTVQDSVRVISDLPTQATLTSDLVGLIAGTSADTATEQSTTEVLSDLPTQATLTSDLVGLIAGTSADSSTTEVFQTFTPEDVIAVMEKDIGVTDKTKSSTSMEEPGLIALESEDSTTVQDSVTVKSDLPPQATLTSDLVGLIAGTSADTATEQSNREVISDLPTQATLTFDLVGPIAGTSADSSTEESTMEVFQTFTPDDITALLESVFGVTDKTKSSTSMEEPGLITHDSEDSTTVQDSVRDLLLQARLTSDLVGLITGASADSATEQDPLEGVGYPAEVWKENVPWVCIGIVGGVILVTAVFLGTMVTLGKL